MTLGTASVCLTVFVLNLHHMRDSVRAPTWVRSLLFGKLSRFLLLPQVHSDAKKLLSPSKRAQKSSYEACLVKTATSTKLIGLNFRKNSEKN